MTGGRKPPLVHRIQGQLRNPDAVEASVRRAMVRTIISRRPRPPIVPRAAASGTSASLPARRSSVSPFATSKYSSSRPPTRKRSPKRLETCRTSDASQGSFRRTPSKLWTLAEAARFSPGNRPGKRMRGAARRRAQSVLGTFLANRQTCDTAFDRITSIAIESPLGTS